jgi:predicted DNA-binding protein
MSQNQRTSLVASTQVRERDKALDAFVNTGTTQGTPAPEVVRVQQQPEPLGARKKVRTAHVTFNIPEDLHTKLKRVAAMTGINMSQIVSEAAEIKVNDLIEQYNLHAIMNL